MSAVVTKLNLPSLRERVSAEEWQARIELAACYRLAHHYNWDGLNFGTHFSARVPGEPEHFLLNPVAAKRLKGAGVEVNRKMLADMAVREPAAFAAMVETAKSSFTT